MEDAPVSTILEMSIEAIENSRTFEMSHSIVGELMKMYTIADPNDLIPRICDMIQYPSVHAQY